MRNLNLVENNSVSDVIFLYFFFFVKNYFYKMCDSNTLRIEQVNKSVWKPKYHFIKYTKYNIDTVNKLEILKHFKNTKSLKHFINWLYNSKIPLKSIKLNINMICITNIPHYYINNNLFLSLNEYQIYNIFTLSKKLQNEVCQCEKSIKITITVW